MINDQIRENYRITFASPEGKKVLEELRGRFHADSPTFSVDPYETAFREGQRSVVLFLQNMLVDQTVINKMLEGYEDDVGRTGS